MSCSMSCRIDADSSHPGCSTWRFKNRWAKKHIWIVWNEEKKYPPLSLTARPWRVTGPQKLQGESRLPTIMANSGVFNSLFKLQGWKASQASVSPLGLSSGYADAHDIRLCHSWWPWHLVTDSGIFHGSLAFRMSGWGFLFRVWVPKQAYLFFWLLPEG